MGYGLHKELYNVLVWNNGILFYILYCNNGSLAKFN